MKAIAGIVEHETDAAALKRQEPLDNPRTFPSSCLRPKRRPSLPLICLETALPAKFAETIQEAIGCQPYRPEALEGIEKLPQRCEVMDADVAKLKAFIATNVS